MSKHLVFTVDSTADPKAVTLTWDVESVQGASLGVVRWYAPWRRYVFIADTSVIVILDAECMHSIAEFVEEKQALHVEVREIRKAMGMETKGFNADLEYVERCKARYNKWTDNQGIHGNRFPAWHELTIREKANWIEDHPA